MSLTVLHVASPFAVSMPAPTNDRPSSDHHGAPSFNGEKRSDDAMSPEAGAGAPLAPPNDAQDLSSASVIFGGQTDGSPDHGYGAPVLSIVSVRAAYADARHDEPADEGAG